MNKKRAIICLLIAGGLFLVGCSTNSLSSPFPDPYDAGQGHTQIAFTDLPAVCTIEIYTLSGDLVKSISETDGDGLTSWDLTNNAGEAIDSGIYNYVVKSADSNQQGKLVVTK